MKKLFAALLALTLTMSLSACGSSSGETSTSTGGENAGGEEGYSEITLKFSTSSAENTLTVQAFKDWGTRLSEATGGKTNVEVYPSSVLGNNTEAAQGAQMGTVDIAALQPGGVADMGATKMNLLALPYLFSSYDQYYDTLMGDIGEVLLQDVTDNVNGLIGFGFLPDGGRCYFTTGKPIRNINDIKGMKLRVQAYAIDDATARALGFSATPTAFSELYQSMQTGVVDGAENPLSGIDGNALYEVSDYLTLDNHTYNVPVLLFSEKTWNSVTEDTRELMNSTWRESVEEFYRPKLVEYENGLIEKFKENGVEVIEAVEDPEAWVEAVQPVWDEYGAGMEDLIEQIQAMS